VYSRLYIFVIYKKAHTIVYLCANVKGIIMLIREEKEHAVTLLLSVCLYVIDCLSACLNEGCLCDLCPQRSLHTHSFNRR